MSKKGPSYTGDALIAAGASTAGLGASIATTVGNGVFQEGIGTQIQTVLDQANGEQHFDIIRASQIDPNSKSGQTFLEEFLHTHQQAARQIGELLHTSASANIAEIATTLLIGLGGAVAGAMLNNRHQKRIRAREGEGSHASAELISPGYA